MSLLVELDVPVGGPDVPGDGLEAPAALGDVLSGRAGLEDRVATVLEPLAHPPAKFRHDLASAGERLLDFFWKLPQRILVDADPQSNRVVHHVTWSPG